MSIGINPLKDDTAFAKLPFVQKSIDILNPKLIEFLDSLDFKLIDRMVPVDIFYNDPHQSGVIHSDRPGTKNFVVDDYAKLIWVYGGGKLKWYELNPSTVRMDVTTPIFAMYNINQVTEVYSQEVANPSIIQVGTPHQGVAETYGRYSISIPIASKKTSKRLTMTESIDMFNDYVIQ